MILIPLRNQLIVGLIVVVGATGAWAAPLGFLVPMTQGQLEDHWVTEGCQAELKNGVLHILGGQGWVRSVHGYRNFVLHLEWKPGRKRGYDSGVFFRSPLPQSGQPWPAEHQINLRQGAEGQVANLPGAKACPGLVCPEAWNRLKLVVRGDRATLWINDCQVWSVQGLKRSWGYLGLQAEVDTGGTFQFRNIWVRELDHRSLLEPGNFQRHWEPARLSAPSCWKMRGSVLFCTGQRGTWLRTREQFDDFNLRLQYKLRPGGNSGVYVRVPRTGEHRGPELGEKQAGVEVQILDDSAPRYKNLKPYQYSASLYAIAPAQPRVSRPPGQWNSLEIDCRGTHYRIWHNGHLVVDADARTHPQLKHRLLRGYLGLQNHHEPVWFRYIRIGPRLPSAADPSP